MSTRARLMVAAAIALISAAGIAIVGSREVHVAIGGRCVRVVVADTPARRERGLRGTVGDLGPYGGMLFAQPNDRDTAFTMAGVTAPLDVAWYTASGSEIDSVRMRPCRHDVAQCPQYRSDAAYRFALETPPGAASPTRLVRCP